MFSTTNVLAALAVATAVYGKATPSVTLPAFPVPSALIPLFDSCITGCFNVATANATGCASNNTLCICAAPGFPDTIADCLKANCTTAESLTVADQILKPLCSNDTANGTSSAPASSATAPAPAPTTKPNAGFTITASGPVLGLAVGVLGAFFGIAL